MQQMNYKNVKTPGFKVSMQIRGSFYDFRHTMDDKDKQVFVPEKVECLGYPFRQSPL